MYCKAVAEHFTFKYRFKPPRSSKDMRSSELFKLVSKEYLIMPLISFVGNVGGTLGMFVGFSFIGLTEWILRMLGRLATFATAREFFKGLKQTDKFKSHLELVIKLGLLVGFIVFAQDAFADYKEKRTGYIETTESISLKDLPTMNACFKRSNYDKQDLTYGADLTIAARISEKQEHNITLEKDLNIPTIFGLKMGQFDQSCPSKTFV